MQRTTANSASCDLAILGGGLAGGLIALALSARRPELSIMLFEQHETLGGDHIWSFFDSDIPTDAKAIIEPLIAASWNGYDVRFPAASRHLESTYNSITSAKLDATLHKTLPADRIITQAKVMRARQGQVSLADGRTFTANAIIDTRGNQGLPHMSGGWQKFVGLHLKLSAPHGLTHPIVMDATVEQLDGYRFLYALPFSDTEIFVEDTYYSDTADLDVVTLRARALTYAKQSGWQVESISYQETGVLPVIADGDFETFWHATDTTETPSARAGTRAALCHPLTSYSLPTCTQFALDLTSLDNLSNEWLEKFCYDWAAKHWREGRFYRMLSTMLFGAADGPERWRMLARFYTLSEPLIERFYSGRSTPLDMARILAGKPPVRITAALASLTGNGRPLADLGTLHLVGATA